jgi:hypothetical protein
VKGTVVIRIEELDAEAVCDKARLNRQPPAVGFARKECLR